MHPQPFITCRHCGHQVPESDRACGYCGAVSAPAAPPAGTKVEGGPPPDDAPSTAAAPVSGRASDAAAARDDAHSPGEPSERPWDGEQGAAGLRPAPEAESKADGQRPGTKRARPAKPTPPQARGLRKPAQGPTGAQKQKALARQLAALATAANLRLRQRLRKYEGRAVGINYDHTADIRPAELVEVNGEYLAVEVAERSLRFTFPLNTVLSIVEGTGGGGVPVEDGKPPFEAVIRLYPLGRF